MIPITTRSSIKVNALRFNANLLIFSKHALLLQKTPFTSSVYPETNWCIQASELVEKGSEGVMKRAYLEVVLGLILTGSVAYAQSGMRGEPSGRGEVGSRGSFVEHAPPGLVSRQPRCARKCVLCDESSVNHMGSATRVLVAREIFWRTKDWVAVLVIIIFFAEGFSTKVLGRGRGVVVFVYGVPYYDYPSYGYSDNGYSDATPYSAPDSSTDYNTDPDTQVVPTVESTNPDTDSYYQPGLSMGR